MPRKSMANYEDQYMTIVEEIMREGVLEFNTRTGKGTKRIPHQTIQVDLSEESPALQTKHVAVKTAIQEIIWIMVKQSNNIKDLGSHIWDKWADENGTIGKAYGSIVKEYAQIDKLIDKIKNDPTDRGMVINLWDLPNLHLMGLRPCCLMTIWSVIAGKLNCHLIQRSGDMMVGVPFNTTQYAALVYMVAQATGTTPGLLTHEITDAHIYDDQFENTEVQIKRYHLLNKVRNNCAVIIDDKLKEDLKLGDNFGFKELGEIIENKPSIVLDPTVENFYDFDENKVKVADYKYMPKLEFEVAQ